MATLDWVLLPPPMPLSCLAKGSGEPIAEHSTGPQSSRSSGRSDRWTKSPFEVPARMMTARSLRRAEPPEGFDHGIGEVGAVETTDAPPSYEFELDGESDISAVLNLAESMDVPSCLPPPLIGCQRS